MLIGIAMIVCAAGLVLSNALSAQKAKESSQSVLSELEQITSQAAEEPVGHSEQIEAADEGISEEETEATHSGEIHQIPKRDQGEPLTVVTIDGHDYIGTLHVPALELDLPIMSDFSYSNLKIAPTRYYGEICTKDLVICAHNYESHFGRLKLLQEGDSVLFVDMNGLTYSYVVSAVDTISPTAIDEVTSGKDDLVLLTCTPGGRARVIVRCDISE